MVELKDLIASKSKWLNELEYICNDGDCNPDLLFRYVKDCMDAFMMKGMARGAFDLSLGIALGAIGAEVIKRIRKKK